MKQTSDNDYERTQLARYQILMQHRQHVERIVWSRIQVLYLIQAGVLGGSFYLIGKRFQIFSPPLLFVGIVLTVILFFICINDWMDAGRNDRSMHNLGHGLGIRRTAERWRIFRRWRIRSRVLLYVVIIFFILLDLALLWYFVSCHQIAYAFGWAIASSIVVIVVSIPISLIFMGKCCKIIDRDPEL